MEVVKLERALKYAQKKIQHPDSQGQFQYISTDAYRPRTSAEIRRELENKIKEIEDFEQFQKDTNEILDNLNE